MTPEGNGYTIDNFAGEQDAPFFLGTWIGKVTGNPGGFISNYREWHILLAAIICGLKTPIMFNVPDCPPLWLDEQQYWDTPCMIANLVRCQYPTITVVVGGWITKILGLW